MEAIGGTIKATIKRKGGLPLIEVQLPKTLHQVQLGQYIDFLVQCRNFSEYGENHIVIMAKAVSDFLDIPLIETIQAEVGDIYSPDVKALDGTISTLFGYIAGLVHKGKGNLMTPENTSFEYKGDIYTIPTIVQQSIAGELTLPKMSVIEIIEAAEIQRFKTQRTAQLGDPDGALRQRIMGIAEVESSKMPEGDIRRSEILKSAERVYSMESEKAGDPKGSLLFSMYLKMLAVICRKEGESLPFDDAEREAWINERAFHFKGINAQVALDIDFFLTSILPSSNNDLPVVGFLSRQSFAVVAATLLKSKKQTKEQGRKTKKYSGA